MHGDKAQPPPISHLSLLPDATVPAQNSEFKKIGPQSNTNR